MSTKLLFVLAILLTCLHAAEAQQPRTIPLIGFIAITSSAAAGQNLEAFRQGLRELGLELQNRSKTKRRDFGQKEGRRALRPSRIKR
jgi:hypothetical protein